MASLCNVFAKRFACNAGSQKLAFCCGLVSYLRHEPHVYAFRARFHAFQRFMHFMYFKGLSKDVLEVKLMLNMSFVLINQAAIEQELKSLVDSINSIHLSEIV